MVSFVIKVDGYLLIYEELLKKDKVFERLVGNVLVKFFVLELMELVLLLDKVDKLKVKKIKIVGIVKFVLKINFYFKFLNLFFVILFLIF